ncbi:head-tail connector protein [Pullulanibacillus sp. KACC 23026]|uniref:head-tail connector protein n=1 Tax=Pullulanibacillus sp. KACC 23026 TaxID=3028315 RepID=UPI0023B15D5E|nr:head-tail connector protein [Pullulanibacillus sp. KACC 23026]WEG14001.1 head-tail connector protein [Pullulanibacillus sp. KACC 23026]
MKISEVQISDLKNYAHVYFDDDDNLFTAILAAGKAFISTYTGLPLVDDPGNGITDSIDDHEDLTIALMVLSNEMYDNRAMTVDNDKLNFVVKAILDSHSVNLL